jgi:hypothetical protein
MAAVTNAANLVANADDATSAAGMAAVLAAVQPPHRQMGTLTAAAARVLAHSQSLEASNFEALNRLQDLQRHVEEFSALVAANQGNVGGGAAAGADGFGASRPTSAAYLRELPRSTLEPHSSHLISASVTITVVAAGGGGDNDGAGADGPTTTSSYYAAIPGEFGAATYPVEITLSDAPLVYCGTGRGGIDRIARDEVQRLSAASREDDARAACRPVVAFFDRGGDVTFARKALLAQEVGASATIVGNTLSGPWPYRMNDLSGEASKEGLRIPTVMVRKEDAGEIRTALLLRDKSISSRQQPDSNNGNIAAVTQAPRTLPQTPSQGQPPLVTCRLEIRTASDAPECPVCLQSLEAGETVLQLRECLHVFHEACALHWLDSHNTCPYCRHELPSDDLAYEQERRQRRQQGRAEDTASSSRGDNGNGFYG